jgi:polar amino acid transport system substrate-binding protein
MTNRSRSRSHRRPGAAVLLAVTTALSVLAACGAPYDRPAPVALPPEVTLSTVAAPNLQTCDNKRPVPAVATYPPLEALPAPGSPMPAGSHMATIQKRGKLVVGTSIDTKLFSSVNPATNRIEGFDVDMARLVAAAIFGPGTDRVELRGITYAQRIPLVASGEVDLVAHTMTINCRRWQQVAFSEVYLYAGQKLLVAVDSDVDSVEDLAGRTVCVSAGGTSADEMRSLKVNPPIEVIEVPNQTDCVVRFQRGDADAIRSDDTVLAGFAAQDPFSKVVGRALTEEPYGLATSLAHPEFTRFVNAVLAKAKADPGPDGWRASYDRWLKPALGEPLATLDLTATGPPTFGTPAADYGRVPPKG